METERQSEVIHMTEDIQKINQHLKNVLGPEKGYFGRVATWGQTANEYEPIGFVSTEDFGPMLSSMTDEQRKNLVMIMTYIKKFTERRKIRASL